ncbi:Gasdermin-D [Camelus dromedarius]|uniref:Gasdermin-D n=1 Tax=Camelus dromedarius TaxID=9838 RepID=A0A5N4CG98_CAMDR|nr:gasdermin-D isoform X1 [Camelus dromedarius]KAB1257877.1 Gasdermin-D [Camelus dromedarius]KAB1257879.1 Gasdermin-D [Camelus dromedarius]KAB1257882.1 Gasdermin-D [Camelus dromedarius]
MASAFERVVKSVVQELDHSQELTPVNSLWSSAGFQPYCLLGRRPSSSWFWRPRYKCVSLSLRDILEPDAPEPAVEQDSPFHFHETMDGQLKGSVKLAVPGQGKISGKAAGSSSSSASVNVCMLRVAPSTWEAMRRERRLRKPEHKILQQLRHRGDDVFVVTEVLQMQKEVEITQTHKQEGSGQFALPGAICLQGKGQGHMSRKKTVTIPSGTILAFRVAQLIIDPDWDILLFPNKKQRTFSGPLQAGRTGPGSQPEPSLRVSDQLKFLSDGLMEDQLETTEDFQGLQLEVGAWAAGLEGLSEEPCGQLLGGLGQVLQDEHALEALEELLERGLCGGQVEPQDGPVGAILECLVLPSRQLEEELAGPVSYLLGALAVLSETQHVLLAEVLEMGALSEVFRLVRSLLEQSSPWQERRAVSLPPELLGSSWGAEAPSWVLLEECGLAPQAGDPQVCWEPEARCCTSALYACLALLSKLSPPC